MFSFVLYQLKDSTIKEYYYITEKKKNQIITRSNWNIVVRESTIGTKQ